MKCFNHPNVDAVGICKNCNKGLCKDCLTEVESGIACTATCVDEVIQVNSLINKNKQSINTTSGAYMRNAYIYGGMGLVCIIYGFQREGLTGFLSIMGLLFLVAAGFSMNSAKKYKGGSKETQCLPLVSHFKEEINWTCALHAGVVACVRGCQRPLTACLRQVFGMPARRKQAERYLQPTEFKSYNIL